MNDLKMNIKTQTMEKQINRLVELGRLFTEYLKKNDLLMSGVHHEYTENIVVYFDGKTLYNVHTKEYFGVDIYYHDTPTITIPAHYIALDLEEIANTWEYEIAAYKADFEATAKQEKEANRQRRIQELENELSILKNKDNGNSN